MSPVFVGPRLRPPLSYASHRISQKLFYATNFNATKEIRKNQRRYLCPNDHVPTAVKLPHPRMNAATRRPPGPPVPRTGTHDFRFKPFYAAQASDCSEPPIQKLRLSALSPALPLPLSLAFALSLSSGGTGSSSGFYFALLMMIYCW